MAGKIPFERDAIINTQLSGMLCFSFSLSSIPLGISKPELSCPLQNVTARFADHIAGLEVFYFMVSIVSSLLSCFPISPENWKLLNTKYVGLLLSL